MASQVSLMPSSSIKLSHARLDGEAIALGSKISILDLPVKRFSSSTVTLFFLFSVEM